MYYTISYLICQELFYFCGTIVVPTTLLFVHMVRKIQGIFVGWLPVPLPRSWSDTYAPLEPDSRLELLTYRLEIYCSIQLN